MVPLFKSVGYQLNRKKNPTLPPPRMCKFPAYKHV